jgi:L1 cell adhesion molecule like protein
LTPQICNPIISKIYQQGGADMGGMGGGMPGGAQGGSGGPTVEEVD